jgi:hypothetical protein
MSPSRAERRAVVRSLPPSLKLVRTAELLFFPVIGFLLLFLPVPWRAQPVEVVAIVNLFAEAVAAVVVAVGLGQRRRWAWILAVVLAAWVITWIVVQGGHQMLLMWRSGARIPVYIVGWTLLMQILALAGCLSTRNWREELT